MLLVAACAALLDGPPAHEHECNNECIIYVQNLEDSELLGSEVKQPYVHLPNHVLDAPMNRNKHVRDQLHSCESKPHSQSQSSSTRASQSQIHSLKKSSSTRASQRQNLSKTRRMLSPKTLANGGYYGCSALTLSSGAALVGGGKKGGGGG